ncbi:MAG: Tfp pilus assembly protein FimT/FimU [Vicinamibacterales bacterium]
MLPRTHEPSVESGFTMPEMLIALAFFMILSGMALATVNAVVPAVRADGQVSRVLGSLQMARAVSISSRRDVEIRFDTGANTLTVARLDGGGAETELQVLAFEYNVKFYQFGDMGDTPEGFGAGGSVDFGNSTELIFTSDGTLVDETGVPVNGTIFVAIEGKRETARAITVTGATARARFYKWSSSGTGWEGGWTAR